MHQQPHTQHPHTPIYTPHFTPDTQLTSSHSQACNHVHQQQCVFAAAWTWMYCASHLHKLARKQTSTGTMISWHSQLTASCITQQPSTPDAISHQQLTLDSSMDDARLVWHCYTHQSLICTNQSWQRKLSAVSRHHLLRFAPRLIPCMNHPNPPLAKQANQRLSYELKREQTVQWGGKYSHKSSPTHKPAPTLTTRCMTETISSQHQRQ